MAIRVEKQGAVTTVILDRPEVRNAVDGPRAQALAEAFRAFDADPDARVAVLWGAGGTFCAGADLKAVGPRARLPRLEPDGRRAHGAHAHAAGQAGDRRGRRPCGGGRAGAGALVRPAGGGGGRGARRLLPALGRAADRRRDGAAAPPHRPARALDLILTGRAVGRRRRWRWGWSTGWCPRAGRARTAEALARELAELPPPACAATAARPTSSWGMDLDAALAREYALGRVTRDSGESREGAARFAAGEGRHGAPAPRR